MELDQNWTLEEAFDNISAFHEPGSIIHGAARNSLLEAWGAIVGRNRALADFEVLLAKYGSRHQISQNLRISRRKLLQLEKSFRSLPQELKKGRLNAGDTVGDWRLISLLGSGGNSDVWRARRNSNEVALKIPKRGRYRLRRFKSELEIMEKISGIQGVMPLIDSSIRNADFDSHAWIAMPVAVSIRNRVAEKTNSRAILKGIGSLAKTLSILHSLSISHRDIKPDNIYYLYGRWVLSDFGIASFPGKEAITQNSRKLGPIYYLAPEMLNKPEESDGRPADIYSLAKTLWVLLSGQNFPPPGEHRTDVSALRISSYINTPHGEELDNLMSRCTSYDPESRLSAQEMYEKLRAMAN